MLHLFKTLLWLPMVFRIEPPFTTGSKSSTTQLLSTLAKSCWQFIYRIIPVFNCQSSSYLNCHQYLSQLIILLRIFFIWLLEHRTLGSSYFPNCFLSHSSLVFSGGSDSKESACNAGDLGLSPGLGKSPGEGNGFPLQYSGLESSMDRGAWQATVHGVTKNRTWFSNFHFHSSLLVLPPLPNLLMLKCSRAQSMVLFSTLCTITSWWSHQSCDFKYLYFCSGFLVAQW